MIAITSPHHHRLAANQWQIFNELQVHRSLKLGGPVERCSLNASLQISDRYQFFLVNGFPLQSEDFFLNFANICLYFQHSCEIPYMLTPRPLVVECGFQPL